MGFLFLFQRVLLAFLLKELNHSSAFPRGRSSMSPESWQVERVKRQDGYGYGNRRPLHYIRALRQANTSNTSDQVEVIPLTEIEESPLMLRSFAPTQNQLQPSYPVRNLYQPWPGTSMAQGMQKKHPLFKPKSFVLNLNVPFANFPGQSKGEDSSIKGSSLSSGEKDEQQLYRPTSVQLSSSFNSPSGSEEKASTKNPNDGKSTHDVTKPSYQFSLSVPIPPPTPSTKPVPQIQGGNSYVQNTYMEPNSVKGGSEWILLNSGAVKHPLKQHVYEPVLIQPTDSKLVTFPPGPLSQLSFLSEPISQSAQQMAQYPQQLEHIQSGYYSPQTQPSKSHHGNSQVVQTLAPDITNVPQSQQQYESIPSGYYSDDQSPVGNNYAQSQSLQPVSPQLPSLPEKYEFQASYDLNQNVQTAPHPPSPVVDQPQYYIPPSGYYDSNAAASNYHGNTSVGQIESSYQHSSDHSGLSPSHPTTFDPTSSTGYQTQMGLPYQYNHREQLNGKPNYAKLLINMDDVADDDDGQYVAAQTANYYSEGGTATHPNSPAYVPIYSQAPVVDSGAGHPQELLEMDEAQTSNPPPAHVSYAPAVGVNSGTVQTNFGQHEPSFHPSHGQYPTNQWQPQYPPQQSNYPVANNGMQQSSHYANPPPSVAPYQY